MSAPAYAVLFGMLVLIYIEVVGYWPKAVAGAIGIALGGILGHWLGLGALP